MALKTMDRTVDATGAARKRYMLFVSTPAKAVPKKTIRTTKLLIGVLRLAP